MYLDSVKHKDGEFVTISYERYQKIMGELDRLETIETELFNLDKGNISKDRAEEILDSLRGWKQMYLGEDPNKIKINMKE